MKLPATAQIYKLQTIFRSVVVQRVQFTSVIMSALDEIESDIKNNRVVVYSKTTCPFCKKAKAALESQKIDYKAIELDRNKNGESIQAALLKLTGAKTVPRVFIKGKCIGGGDDTVAMAKNGKLKKMVFES